MSHGYSTTIRMGAERFDISFGGQRVDLLALLHNQTHGKQAQILREATRSVCLLHGIGKQPEEPKASAPKVKRVRKATTTKPRHSTATHVSLEATL